MRRPVRLGPLQGHGDPAVAQPVNPVLAERRMHEVAAEPCQAGLDLRGDGPPLQAHRRGGIPIYPASVVKFVYLMAAYAWRDEGRHAIDPETDALLTAMIHDSNNQATRKVFARLTATEPGPELSPDAYPAFRERRLAVQR
jgi:hypothetical protein